MLIVSAPDRLVRDPATSRPIDDVPTPVDETSPYWARLIADRDVVEAAEPTQTPAAPLEKEA